VPPDREAQVVTSSRSPTALPRPSALGRENWTELFEVVVDALRIFPPLYASSILGRPWSWLPPHHGLSEFRVLDVWRLGRALKYLIDVTLPGIPRTPPPFGPPIVNALIWRPTVILQRPDHNGSYTTYPKEAWFFVNGILTNDGVAHINAAYLADLFHRPVTVVQNSTGTLAADLVECALGKQWYRATESVNKAFPAIYDALKSEKERVVVVAHSQGTIITAVVLRLLQESLRMAARRGRPGVHAVVEPVPPHDWPIKLEEFEPVTATDLQKLEIYCFANCASRMAFVDPMDPAPGPIPWIESFGNEYDVVARLGMLAPHARQRGIRIAGPRYVRRGAWGHLLNEHYLRGIEASQRTGHARGGRGSALPFELLNPEAPHQETPRLFAYINGGTPPARSGRPAERPVAIRTGVQRRP
jgi:pimeloyl-ACP methyl ester carboxylesterase